MDVRSDKYAKQPAPSTEWQFDLRQSEHPLADCIGHVVALDDVTGANPPNGPSDIFSRSTLGFLVAAAGFARALPEPMDGSYQFVLDLDAALIELRTRLGSQTDSSYQYLSVLDPSHFGNGWDADPATQREKPGLDTVMLEPGVVDALALAAWVASEKPTEIAPVTLDAFIFGLLGIAGERADRLGRALAAAPSTAEAGSLRQEVGERLPQMANALGNKSALKFAMRAPQDWPPLPGVSERPGFDPDRAISDTSADLLGFSEDARALSELLCLQDTGARAVGVFGNWGSGKSSLLNLVEGQIDTLLAQKQPVATLDGESGPDPFIRRVQHVRFNVWDYNDDDLMLALANVTVRSLKDYIAMDDLKEELGNKQKQLNAERTSAEERIKNAQKKHATATHEIKNANGRAKTERCKAKKTAIDSINLLAQDKWTETGTATELLNLAAEGRVLFSTLSLAHLRYLRAANWGTWSLALLLAGLIGYFVYQFGDGENTTLTALMALMGFAVPFVRFLNGLASTLSDYASKLGKAEHDEAETVEEQRRERDLAREEIALQTRLMEASLAKIESYEGDGVQPLWRYLLNESTEAHEIEQSLGLTSRLRDMFAKIDDNIEKYRAEPLSENHTIEKEHGSKPPPDRVIFYVDELDRCRAQQVVRMLEAIHLLLAFDNFAVVVAVDQRWLVASLKSVFEKEMAGSKKPDNDASQITAHEYIEKIIQVPVQVRSLAFEPAPEGSDDKPSGSFVKLIDKLTSSGKKDNVIEEKGGGERRGGNGIDPLQIAAEDVMQQTTLRAAEERARLTETEIEGLRHMGAIVGTSPRAVKRFVNLYRLVRALRTGADFDKFRYGDFESVQLSLALQTGLNAYNSKKMRDWLNAEGDKERPTMPLECEKMLKLQLVKPDGRDALRRAWVETERFAFWNGATVLHG